VKPTASCRLCVVPSLLLRLRALLQWFHYQRCFGFISSSLLFVYEGDTGVVRGSDEAVNSSTSSESCGCGCGAPPKTCNGVDLRMIDFPHVSDSSEVEGCRDEGYIVGLETVIRTLEGLLLVHHIL
jgi:hypothetical protein